MSMSERPTITPAFEKRAAADREKYRKLIKAGVPKVKLPWTWLVWHSYREAKRNGKQTLNARSLDQAQRVQDRGKTANYVHNYNSIEGWLLASAVVVTLSGMHSQRH